MKKKSIIISAGIIIIAVFYLFYSLQNHQKSDIPVSQVSNQEATLTKVVLGTDWFAQAEHGGFYQALADGTYKKYGLDVQIKMGGPQINGMQLLISRDVNFIILPSFVMLTAAQKKLPVISLAAVFQKDLQILMAHPGVGNDSLTALKNKPIFISPPTAASIWGFLVGKYGYNDSQKRPYSHSLLPFLNDSNSIQEGLLTSEPFTVEKQAGFKPVVMLLSNEGFSAYGELITCLQDFEKNNSKIVQAFIRASMEGWKNYLKNPTMGNSLIKKDNPQMQDDLLQYAVEKLKEEKIVTGGDAEKLGIGAMTDKRWSEFYQSLIESRSIEPNIDIKSVYTLKYIQSK